MSLLIVCACGNKTTPAEYSGSMVVDSDSISSPYQAVDLGLSVKWANMNVDAESPEDYGGYYAWGETDDKSNYDESTYKYYINDAYQNIGDDISGTEYDVAHMKMGGDWRMPTITEWEELIKKCTWVYGFCGKIQGYIVSGPSGKSIFLPGAGCKTTTDNHFEKDCYYWSSTLPSRETQYCFPYNIQARPDAIFKDGYAAIFGHPVRAVRR